MEYAMSLGGLVVHSRDDWPCACCRPAALADRWGFCLCVKCARTVMRITEAGADGMRGLLDDLTDALTVFDADPAIPQPSAN
ncbi:MAG: hypothetical protein ACRD3T_20555 [Terriglobia bacterium]